MTQEKFDDHLSRITITHYNNKKNNNLKMSQYRRHRLAGGTFFFTVALLDRKSRLLVEKVGIFRAAVARIQRERPFKLDAMVVLPDHFHCVITLPVGDDDYMTRLRLIKFYFSHALPKTEKISIARANKKERGIWQRRYWEHTIRSDEDYRRHMDYVHINPVKHKLVKRVIDWPYSSFHRYVAKGVYPSNWAGDIDIEVSGEVK